MSARRLTTLTSPAGGFGYNYDPVKLRRVTGLSLSNGATIANSFDNVARLTGTSLLNSGGTILDQYTYGYNQAGQRTNVVRTAGDSVNFAYDSIGELTAASGFEKGGSTARLQEQLRYVYDPAGNLNYRTNNALVQTFKVNNLNELTNITRTGTFTVAGTTSSGATNVTVNTSNTVLYADRSFASTNQTLTNGITTFTAIAKDFLGNLATNAVVANLPATNNYIFDLNGNLRTNGSRVLDYDDENQLMRVTVTNAWKDEFVYDGKFRRRIERDYTWSGSAWTQTNEVHFIYDGNAVIQERDSNNVPLVTYTRGVGGLLARTDLNGSTFYHADGNANITMLIDKNQAVVAKYLYDPFGNILSMSGPMANANTYRFASKEWNANTGLYYFGRRYYDPNLQRFVNRDPIAENGGLNLYGYCGNNPVSLIDLLGLCPTWWDDYLAFQWKIDQYLLNPGQLIERPFIQAWDDYWAVGGGIEGLNVAVNENNLATPLANLVYQENILTGEPFTWWGDYSINAGHLGLNLMAVVPFARMASLGDAIAAETGAARDISLFRTGNAQGPTLLRASDIEADANGMVAPGQGGLSTFNSAENVVTKGHLYELPPQAPLPPQVRVVPDNILPGHVSLEPAYPMSYSEYQNAVDSIIWQTTGIKLK